MCRRQPRPTVQQSVPHFSRLPHREGGDLCFPTRVRLGPHQASLDGIPRPPRNSDIGAPIRGRWILPVRAVSGAQPRGTSIHQEEPSQLMRVHAIRLSLPPIATRDTGTEHGDVTCPCRCILLRPNHLWGGRSGRYCLSSLWHRGASQRPRSSHPPAAAPASCMGPQHLANSHDMNQRRRNQHWGNPSPCHSV